MERQSWMVPRSWDRLSLAAEHTDASCDDQSSSDDRPQIGYTVEDNRHKSVATSRSAPEYAHGGSSFETNARNARCRSLRGRPADGRPALASDAGARGFI